MFLTTDVFFYPLVIELQWSAQIRTQYFDSHFLYIWNVIHSQKTTLPVTITSFWNMVYFFCFATGQEPFPGLGSLTFYSSVASYSFYWPSWRSAANSFFSYTLTYQFLNFLPSGIQSGEKSDVGRLCMNHTLKFILTFTLLIFRTKQGAWYKQIQLVKGSDFLIVILSSQHFIGNTFTHTALWELHRDESYLSQKEKPIFCLYQSSFSKWVQQSPT